MGAVRHLFVASTALLSAACTALLGIDEEYVLEELPGGSSNGGSSASTPPFEHAGDAGEGGSGSAGALWSFTGAAGGVDAVGGLSGTEYDAAPSPPPPPPPPPVEGEPLIPCEPGTFRGSFDGGHTPSPIPFLNVGFVRVDVSGTVDLVLDRTDPNHLTISSGHLEGDIKLFANMSVPFRASLVGALDCTTRRLDAQLIEGIVGDATTLYAVFTGEATGVLEDAKRLSGTWREAEVDAINANGNGSWHAERVDDRAGEPVDAGTD